MEKRLLTSNSFNNGQRNLFGAYDEITDNFAVAVTSIEIGVQYAFS